MDYQKKIDDIVNKIKADKFVHANIKSVCKIHIDRQLPFLCVYQKNDTIDDRAIESLVKTEASYLIVQSSLKHKKIFKDFILNIAQSLSQEFGAYYFLELFPNTSQEDLAKNGEAYLREAIFNIYPERTYKLNKTIDVLISHLKKIKIQKLTIEVNAHYRAKKKTFFREIIRSKEFKNMNLFYTGLEIPSVYKEISGNDYYPLIVRNLRRSLSKTLKRTFHSFANHNTSTSPKSYLSLGKRAFNKKVWEVDRQLSEIEDSFDFLFLVTPFNIEEAWRYFKKNKYQIKPEFRYRPLPVDPISLKRSLYQVRTDKIDDPVLEQIFTDKQKDLDLQLSMLDSRGTNRFLYGSIQLFRPLTKDVIETAHLLLKQKLGKQKEVSRKGYLNAFTFAELARSEIEFYKSLNSNFNAKVEIKEDMNNSLLVSRGNLLIGKNLSVPKDRANALIQHEIGTHSLTYFNGTLQPFKQLSSGFAEYEELQEGLAVLAEYLVGGLNDFRLKLLALRVIAVDLMCKGASFVETFNIMAQKYQFDLYTSFLVATRTYRGGGYTKDAVYLRGFLQLLDYLKNGNELDLLYYGKFAKRHIAFIKELTYRKVLNPNILFPKYFTSDESKLRLEKLRKNSDITKLIKLQNSHKRR
ncbi:MAG: tyrosine/phenylalanine carboxypeptidase domain-containing protein [Pseudomonadota bacterium]